MPRVIDLATVRARGAYTIIELAVVLAIVGILSAVTGSQYMSYLDRARTARAIVELRGIAAQIDPAGDDDATYPATLADAGIATLDPWGNPYQYLLIQGNLPRGMSSTSGSLPPVAAPPAGASGSGNENGGGGGGGENASGGPPEGAGGGEPSAIALARKDRFLVPINSDFDLYSSGPDGESRATLNAPVSRDDIIRANDGAFYGVAEDF